MPRTRAAFARSTADRDMHRHLGRAAASVRAAMDVCGRTARGQTREEATPYRERQKRLSRAEKLINDIGHLDADPSGPDPKLEARALCAWLESRERSKGTVRPSRRGQDYQRRLHQVLGFLTGEDSVEEEPSVLPESKPEMPAELAAMQDPSEALWARAEDLAREQGEAGNDAYIEAIFRRLVGEVTDG